MTLDHIGAGDSAAVDEQAKANAHGEQAQCQADEAPPDSPVDEAQEGGGHRKNPKRKARRRRVRAWLRLHGRELDVISNVVIAIFAIVVGFTSYWQSRDTQLALVETQKSNRLTQEANRLTRLSAKAALQANEQTRMIEAPDVYVTRLTPGDPPQLLFTNAGKTTARGVRVKVSVLFNPIDGIDPGTVPPKERRRAHVRDMMRRLEPIRRVDPSFYRARKAGLKQYAKLGDAADATTTVPPEPASVADIPPGVSIGYPATPGVGVTITGGGWDSIMYYGTFTYRDRFGDEHAGRFCFVHDLASDSRTTCFQPDRGE